MRDIIVTTPKGDSGNAAREAESIKSAGKGSYFRTLGSRPVAAGVGSRVFYVERGYIRGFATVTSIESGEKECSTTGRKFKAQTILVMDATSWKWVEPIPHSGFQGWRYFDPPKDMEVVGGFRDPMPQVS